MSTVQDWQPFEIFLSPVSLDADLEAEIERLSAPHPGPDGWLFWDAAVLDADKQGLREVYEWVQRFRDAYLNLRRWDQRGASAREAASMVAERSPRTTAPAIVVLVSTALLEGPTADLDGLAAAGAIVYEKPPDLQSASLNELTDWLREELNRLYSQFWTDGQEFLLVGRALPEEPSAGPDLRDDPANLAAYVDPVYRLSDEDFEALLDRSRIEDPLATGE